MMKKVMKTLLALLAALVCGGAWAEVPNATMSCGFDGSTAVSGVVGGTAPTSVSEWNANNADYELVRGSSTDKAMKVNKASGTAHAPYASKPSGMADSSSWTVNIVAKLPEFTASSPNTRHVIWGVSGAVWSNGAKGIGLVYTAANTVALEYVAKNGGNNSYNYTRTVLVDNVELSGLTDAYHVFTVTFNASASGTEESPYYTLYVDGVQKGTSGTTAKQTGYVDNWCVGNYYGGALQVRAAYADGMYVDDFAIWATTSLDSAQVRELAKKFPVWPADVGDEVVWSNLDSTANSATHFSVGSGKNAQMNLSLPSTIDTPVGTVVSISAIKIANGDKTMPNTMTINGYEGTKKGITEDFTPKGSVTAGTIDRLFIYEFATPAEVSVGTAYDIGWKGAGGAATYSEVSGVADNSPIGITGLTGQYANHKGYCEIVTTIKSFPTLPDTISYAAGDPSDWQSTGVGVAPKDKIAALKEIANRYTFAATFGNTAMDATPRDGTPLNVTLHSDGVLIVEMQVVNGGHKKAALVGFKVDGGLLKVKRIKSAYAPTTFSGPLMTYSNGTASRTTGTSGDGSYILANVTLTRITKFKDDAVAPDFLSTTAPIIRYDASAYDNFTYNENGEVQSWKDMSANNNNATPAAARSGNTDVTRYGRVEVVNGVPAFQMGDAGSCIDLGFTRKTDIRTVFWVMDIKQTQNAFFLGDVDTDQKYHFHRGGDGKYADGTHAPNEYKNGAFTCDGATVANVTSTIVPTGLHVFSVKTTGNVTASRLSQDRDQNDRNGGRAISELVVFNTELTDEQISAMNNYLLYKWMGIESGEISATLPDGSQNFSEIAWNDGGKFANGKDVTLTVDSTTTLTIDEEALIGSLTLTGAGTLTINNAQNLSFGSVDISGFTGTINYNVDATRAAFAASEGLKALMKSGTDNMTFTFTGSGSNGATVDYGSTQDTTTDVIFSCHIVFDGGTHTLKYVHEKGGSKFGANATAANPTLLVTNNATLNFTGKNWCGWESGAVNANGIVRVNSGSTLNANTDSVGTFYWAQQFYLEPGSTTNFRSNNQSVRFNGGISESAPQIYVPECAADKANKIATVNLANSENLDIINQGTRGSAFFVGANATLKIGGNLICNENFTKYGDGILQITGNVTNSGTKTIAAGLYDIGAMRDFTTPGWTVSGTGGFLIHETSAEYAKADLTVTNPNSYTIKVVRPNGSTVYDLATVVDDTTIKISGAATSFDVTFNTKDTGTSNGHIDYQCLDYVRLQYDSTPTYINETTTPGSKTMGVYLKHHPYVHNLENNNDAWFKSTDEITLAVVGQMPSTHNTVFLHMGRSVTKNGLFLATGTNETQVVIGYNKQNTLAVIDTLDVPNASTARHAYVITKHDDPEGTVNRQTTFDIWLDGEMINTKKFDHFVVTGGIQVGKPYGDSFSGWNNVGDSDSTSYINLIRVYDRVISEAEILKYSDSAEYPYNSPQGTYQRNFTTVSGQMWKGADNAWTSSLEGEESGVALPLKGLVTANFAGATTITVNQTEATSYEKLILNGASDGDSTITFEKGEGAVVQISTLNTTINTPVVIKEGALDLSGGPTKISAHGHVTFDYSSLTAQDVLTDDDGAASFKVTGLTQATADQFTLIKPTDARLDVSLVKHNDNNSYYVEATVKPVYLNNDNTFKLADGTAVATLLDGDKVIVSSVGYDGNQRWQVNLNNAALTGHTIVIDYPNGGTNPGVTIYSDIYDGVDIEILEGSKMYMTSNKSVWATSVSGDGTFSVGTTFYLHKTLTVTCTVQTTGSGEFCLESDSALNVPANSSVKVTAYSGNQGYVKKTTADNVDTYTFVAGTQEIEPSDDPDAPAVIIEDVGQGIIVNPGAEVEVKLPENATQEQLTTIAGKISVKYTIPGSGTVKDLKADGLVTVAVNQETGAVELTTTDAAKPADTAITMATPTEGEGEEATDKVQFTISNPIPGLFYAVSACDTPDGDFTSATGDQATSAAAKTVSIPMEFSNGKKVKYYKVSVKATK